MFMNYNQLREDLKQGCYGAAFIGGFGGAMMESFDIDDASDEELEQYAKIHGINTDYYLEKQE